MPKSRLVELYAHGLGVIDDARLELGSGFNVLTGETGAGKTLLIGALDLCLGGDGAPSRYAMRADLRTAAVFEIEGEGDIVVTREVSPAGRLRSTLNGVPSSAETLRGVTERLIVIHGQHDSLALRNRSEVLAIIDASAGVSTAELDAARRRLRDARELRGSFGGDESQRSREREFVEFQIDELQSASITSGNELRGTLNELTRLTQLRDGQAALAQVIEELDAERDDAALSLMARAIDRLPLAEPYDPARSLLRGALEQAREAVHELTELCDPDSFDVREMDRLERRASTLQQIARKYGGSLDAALAVLTSLRADRERLNGAAESLHALDEEIRILEQRELLLAREARRERLDGAARLTDAVRAQLPRVALEHASIRFEVDGDDGSDARILFAPNPGFGEGPLQSMSSGGELSRVLLALSLESASENVVAVFDEVDAGIGGQVAQQIGECLSELGSRQQVLAVTHLASVAAKADHHFVIEKFTINGITTTSTRPLSGEDRVNEIARMLAGDAVTEQSRALARVMLEISR